MVKSVVYDADIIRSDGESLGLSVISLGQTVILVVSGGVIPHY